jgi:predicted GNAT family N-acyltransferase/limonene-1,2-epoxide hydrolase
MAVVRLAESPGDRRAAWRIREQVFIGEQGIAERDERDGLDDVAWHLVAWEGDSAIGTARVLGLGADGALVSPASSRVAKIGRMAVVPQKRRLGVGRQLLESALDLVRRHGADRAELSAQEYVVPFYERAGFRVEGAPYLEAGIAHRKMSRPLAAEARMPTLAEARALFEKRRAAWLAGDVDAYLALWADDMTFRSPVHAEPLRGREAFADLVRQSLELSRPLRFDFAHIAVAGSVILAEWTIAIERRDTRNVIEWRGMSACEVRDGRIRWWREYWNPSDLVSVAPIERPR